MQRREFLKLGVAAALAPVITGFDLAVGEDRTVIRSMVGGGVSLADDGCFYLLMHRRQFDDLRHGFARDRWRDAYRRYRQARKTFGELSDPRAILANYGELDQWKPIIERGTFEGIRIIQT